MTDFPYYWAWKGHVTQRQRASLTTRCRHRLRVICRGTMNSALVEFEDGFRAVVSRNGLRRGT